MRLTEAIDFINIEPLPTPRSRGFRYFYIDDKDSELWNLRKQRLKHDLNEKNKKKSADKDLFSIFKNGIDIIRCGL